MDGRKPPVPVRATEDSPRGRGRSPALPCLGTEGLGDSFVGIGQGVVGGRSSGLENAAKVKVENGE